MKTKFIGTPTGPPGKQTRRNLRSYGEECLRLLFVWLAHCDYPQLKFLVSYTLPIQDKRGYFEVWINPKELIKFYISPATLPGRYLCDKVVFVVRRNEQTVFLEVKDHRLNDLFDYYERTGAVRVELEKAQRAN